MNDTMNDTTTDTNNQPSDKKPLYVRLSTAIGALANCREKGNVVLTAFGTLAGSPERKKTVWEDRWERIIDSLCEHLPSGAGIDNGCKFLADQSNAKKLVFQCDYHHMNERGYYDGWTEHRITVTPTFGGFEVKVGGRNRNDIKDYLAETVSDALETPVAFD